MSRQQSEGEVHVEAMRLILAEMERREGPPDWTIWQHMLNMLETIFQGIVDQRADDADEIETLRKELANAQRELSEQGQAHSVELQQETAGLREQLDAARAAVTLQRAGIERLQAFVGMVRELLAMPLAQISYDDMSVVRAELAALDDEPTPVAERCPECDGSGMVDSGGFGPDGKGINVPCGGDCRGNPCPSQPTPVAEPIDAEGGA